MTFVALLAAGITLTISTCLNVWQRSVEAAELNQEARAVVELLSRDISGAYLGLERKAGYMSGLPAQEAECPVDRLTVCTGSNSVARAALLPDDLRANWSLETHPPVTDYVAVSYEWLPADVEAPAGLYRAVQLVPRGYDQDPYALATGDMEPDLISEAVVELGLRYFDGQQWMDSWQSTEEDPRLPRAVSIEMILCDARGREHAYQTIVPVAAM